MRDPYKFAQCQHCWSFFRSLGLASHRAACQRKKKLKAKRASAHKEG